MANYTPGDTGTSPWPTESRYGPTALPTEASYGHSAQLPMQIAFGLCLPVLGIFLNSLVVAALARGHLAVSATNQLNTALAAADIVFSLNNMIFVLPNVIANRLVFGWEACLARSFLVASSAAFNMGLIFSLATTRFLIVCHPNRKLTLLVKRKIHWVIIGTLVASVAISVPVVPAGMTRLIWPNECIISFMFDDYLPYVLCYMMIFYILPALIMPVLYGLIFRSIYRNNKRVASMAGSSGDDRNRGIQTRVALMLLVVYVIFVTSVTPFFAMSLTYHVSGNVDRRFLRAGGYVFHIQGIFNPLIYDLLNPTYREAFRKLFGLHHENEADTSVFNLRVA